MPLALLEDARSIGFRGDRLRMVQMILEISYPCGGSGFARDTDE